MATTNWLSLSTGTTNEISPCLRALKKHKDDWPLARPESTMNTQVCWDNANGLLKFPFAIISNGRKIDATRSATVCRVRAAAGITRRWRAFLHELFSAPCRSSAKVIDEIARWAACSLNRSKTNSGLRLITSMEIWVSSR